MNITELKELAEKATPGPWEWDGDVSNYDPENEAPWLAQAPWTSRDSKNVLMGTIKAVRAEDAAYIAAANPAEILELIAKLEAAEQTARYESDLCQQALDSRKEMEGQLDDAQGEIRALRATEAGLRERVKELEEGLRELYKGYVNLLQGGKDRIESLGGTCDAVDRMESDSPYLRSARALLEKKE